MDQYEQKLFADLIQASRTLVTTCNLASSVLSEEFEDMVSGPAMTVKEILDKCPEGGIAWDGSFNEADVEESEFNTGVPGMKGMRLKHLRSEKAIELTYPAGDSVSQIAHTREIAMTSLRNLVSSYVKRQRELGVL